jgi:hypothetical protein
VPEKKFADYSLWVQLANDPSQTEEARQYYRSRMEGVVHAQMRDAFRFAGATSAATEKAPNTG